MATRPRESRAHFDFLRFSAEPVGERLLSPPGVASMTHLKSNLTLAISRSRVLAGHTRGAKRRKLSLGIESLEDRLAPAIIATPSQTFVNQVYQDLLGRMADSGGLAFWSGLVDQGVSRTRVVGQMQTSL